MQCTLAHKYEGQDVTGWWMSEKYDGVRAIWDGKNFLSRTEKILHAPVWFKEGLPKDVILDGELWCGRGNFQETVGIVRSHLGNSNWRTVEYRIFDVVVAMLEVEKRWAVLEDLELSQPDCCFQHAEVVTHTKCVNIPHLRYYESLIFLKGGEGVMLKAPCSYYEQKRTKNLLKMKRMKHSTAIVIGHTKGKGRHEGRVGALTCNWCGKRITVGSGLTDDDRNNPTPIGTEINIKYFDITEAGLPRFPIYEGVIK